MAILVYLGLFLVSLLPAIILYKWLKKQEENEKYKIICKNALVKGILTIFPILLASLTFHILGKIIFIGIDNVILYRAYYTFVVLAFSEELVKYLTFKKLIKSNDYAYSWFNITIFMTIVGLGFGCIENSVVTIGSNFIIMLIRGISMGHVGYGFIMGWLYGKMLKTKKKIYGILSFMIPWILHGLYDFGLSDELIAINDNFAFLSVTLEIVCIVFVFLIIRFVKKRKASLVFIEPFEKVSKN